MNNEGIEKLAFPPEATQSSYERVLEWNTQTAAFNRKPGSVPNDKHNPEGMESLRDDMALEQHLPDSSDRYDAIGYGQMKSGFEEVSSTMNRIRHSAI